MDAKILGLRIRQARERIRLSQGEFADEVGRDQKAISEIENGKRRLPVTELPEFAQVLNVPITYFFTGTVGQDNLDEIILDEFHRLPSTKTKEAAIGIMRLLADSHR